MRKLKRTRLYGEWERGREGKSRIGMQVSRVGTLWKWYFYALSHQLHMAYNSNIIIPIHYWLFDIEVTNVTTMMLHPAPTRYKWQIMNHENSAAQVFRIYTLFTCVSSYPHLSRSLSLLPRHTFCYLLLWTPNGADSFFRVHSLKFHPQSYRRFSLEC